MLESARTCVGTRATWDGVAKNLMLPQTRAHVTVYGIELHDSSDIVRACVRGRMSLVSNIIAILYVLSLF